MESKIIGIKQLQSQLKQVAESALRGESFTVVRNSKPVFKIEPVVKQQTKKYTLKDLNKLQFKGDKDLSKNIDKIVYGL